MKFSWKISISMMTISILVMGLGGCVLLGALFSSAWNRETRNAAEENRMLSYSFVAYWNTTVQEWQNFTDEEIQEYIDDARNELQMVCLEEKKLNTDVVKEEKNIEKLY